MAFGNVLKANPTTTETSEVGHIVAKLNELFQQDGTDLKLNLTASGKEYIRYNTTSLAIEFYINDVLEGHINAAELLAD